MSGTGHPATVGRSTATIAVTCSDGGATSHADMVSRCLHCRHETEIYVRSTISTGTNSEREMCKLQHRRSATCMFGTLRSC
jgi:hypothetical protein